jgi:hypothetical protein
MSDLGKIPEDKTVWVIKFEDADVSDLVFMGFGAEEAAKETYKIRKQSWNCHLLCSYERLAQQDAREETLKGLLREMLDAHCGISHECGSAIHRSARAALGTDQQLQPKGEQG